MTKKDTFRDLAGGVRPLPPRASRIAPPSVASTGGRSGPRAEGRPAFDVADDGQTIEGVRRGFADLLVDVKRGRFPIAESIDLHGLHFDEAKRTLLGLARNVRGAGRRLALVVHGKGTHSPGGRGVLRDEMASWLSSPPLAQHVLCFATASAAHGGSGATYVLFA